MDSESENKTEEHETSNTDEQTSKKGRHRKKQLYNSILQQMEFYFSDSNLTKDRFLSKLLEENPYVDLNVFLKFNKIRKLTSSVEDIRKAIKKSQIIELSEDNNKICRKEPVKVKMNVDECTIYVERLKPEATHEWLASVFSEFGNVVYVSIPKYKHNNANKGFAFVEFDKESEAEKALNYFKSLGCKMPSTVEPEQLYSIATYGTSNDENVEENSTQDEQSRKRKHSETDNEIKEKKQKIENGELSESEDTENKKKKKAKKEHKKKNYIKEIGLQVLSKKEWKRMRNRYLELQRKKMKEFKKHLYKSKYGQAKYEDVKNTDTSSKPQKNNSQEVSRPEGQKQESSKSDDEKAEKLTKEKSTSEFTEGLIVKIKLMESVVDAKKFRNEIKSLSPDVAYVDIPNPGSEDVYVRFSNSKSAKKFCTKEFSGKKLLLTGEEEKAYWKKITEERELKVNREKKKQRGRDKLLKKAKHVKFDE